MIHTAWSLTPLPGLSLKGHLNRTLIYFRKPHFSSLAWELLQPSCNTSCPQTRAELPSVCSCSFFVHLITQLPRIFPPLYMSPIHTHTSYWSLFPWSFPKSSFSTFAHNPDTPLLPKCHWHKWFRAYHGLGKAVKDHKPLPVTKYYGWTSQVIVHLLGQWLKNLPWFFSY